jgi:hypothetical protein
MPADRLLHPRCGHSEKVSALTGDEYRVWTQYLLSADDFGVMVRSAVKLQADNYALQRLTAKRVERLLERVITMGLIHPFDHQGRRFVYQHDWQSWQKIEWPRTTIHPKPDPAILTVCDEATQKLFGKHPGGKFRGLPKSLPSDLESSSQVLPKSLPSDSGTTSQVVPEQFPSHSRAPLTANGLRLTADGSRQTASGSEGGPGETTPAFLADEALRTLQEAYPQQRVTYGYKTETAWIEQLNGAESAAAASATMLAHLENHKRSYEWRVKRMIPALDKWLREGLWQRTMDEDPPVAESQTARRRGGAYAGAAYDGPDPVGHVPPCPSRAACLARQQRERQA